MISQWFSRGDAQRDAKLDERIDQVIEKADQLIEGLAALDAKISRIELSLRHLGV